MLDSQKQNPIKSVLWIKVPTFIVDLIHSFIPFRGLVVFMSPVVIDDDITVFNKSFLCWWSLIWTWLTAYVFPRSLQVWWFCWFIIYTNMSILKGKLTNWKWCHWYVQHALSYFLFQCYVIYYDIETMCYFI